MKKREFLLFILLFFLCIIGIGTNMTNKEQIPQEVKDFFQKYEYNDNIDYIGQWKEYKVYSPDYSKDSGTVWGLPQYVLHNDNEIKWASPDERDEIMSIEN